MSNRCTKETDNNKSNEVDAANLYSLNVSNGIFLTINNVFKNAVKVKDESIKKLVEVQNYKGIIESVFTINDIKCVAVDIGEKQEMEDVIEVYLFNEKIKGMFVKYDSSIVKEIGNCFNYLTDSRFIDMSKSCHFRTILSETEKKKYKYVKVKDSHPSIYGDCLQIVKINCVECMEIKKNVFDEKCFVKVSDIEEVKDMSSVTQYHKQVIIKRESILKFEAVMHEKFKINDLVRFTDSDDNTFKGILLWTGKLNDKSAGIVSIEDFGAESIDSYKIDENEMQTHFKTKKSGICVGIFALVRDVVSYMKCNEINLDVVDPKHIYEFARHSFTEKILIFSVDEKRNILKLKWKGSIFSQLCIGCELIFESNQGTNGTYGNETLFNCSPKKGVLITADKVKLYDIRNLCELGCHNDLKFISTENGYKIYDVNSICCIENLDRIDEKPKLKIGCKITYENASIGTCIFIGKVNDKLSVGIEISINYVNSDDIVLDVINSYAFRKGKPCFVDMQHINIGTFYQTDSSKEISNGYNDSITNTRIIYYPGNDRTKQTNGLPGKVKWYGKHENGKGVCGINLDSEVDQNKSKYFLEDLFTYAPKHGIIDDKYKIEYIATAETESSFSVQPSENYSKDKIIRSLLEDKFIEVIEDLIKHDTKQFLEFLKGRKEINEPNTLLEIIDSLYSKKKFKEIEKLLSYFETINDIFYTLKMFLSKCIKDEIFDFINNILEKLTVFQNDDKNNETCLNLAIKCLEQIKEFGLSNPIDLLYEKFIEKCQNRKFLISRSNELQETFITEIILNNSICEETKISVIKSEKFDIDQLNSNQKSPMELAIELKKNKLLQQLFASGCNIDKLKSIFDDIFLSECNQNMDMNKSIYRRLQEE